MEHQEVRYTTKEFSKMMDINVSTLYKYEKDFNLVIPRSKNNERYYTEKEKDIFEKIKVLREKKFSIQNIKEYLNKNIDLMEQEEKAVNNVPMQYLTGEEVKELLMNNMQSAMKEITCTLQEELKETIKEELRKEFKYQQEQQKSENKKLIDYIASTREEEKKKSIWDKIFKK